MFMFRDGVMGDPPPQKKLIQNTYIILWDRLELQQFDI